MVLIECLKRYSTKSKFPGVGRNYPPLALVTQKTVCSSIFFLLGDPSRLPHASTPERGRAPASPHAAHWRQGVHARRRRGYGCPCEVLRPDEVTRRHGLALRSLLPRRGRAPARPPWPWPRSTRSSAPEKFGPGGDDATPLPRGRRRRRHPLLHHQQRR
jgi:hypothetical protein